MTVPFIMALGVGLSAARSDPDGTEDSFGLVALCSIGPILMVLLLGIFLQPDRCGLYCYCGSGDPYYCGRSVAIYHSFSAIHRRGHDQHPAHRRRADSISVAHPLLPQAPTAANGRWADLHHCGADSVLTGVNVGFAPVGALLGEGMGESSLRWLLVPIGIVIGYYLVKAEPAVQVLNQQVEDVTGGTVSRGMMNLALSAGIACAVALSMVRVLTGLNIYWIIIPGYALALLLSRQVPPVFVGIAFDSGGAASGPMTSTFLLPLAMGACSAVGGNVSYRCLWRSCSGSAGPWSPFRLWGLSTPTNRKNRFLPASLRWMTDLLTLRRNRDGSSTRSAPDSPAYGDFNYQRGR